MELRPSFFSISFDLVLKGEPIPYDIFINSSSHVYREKFVRVFPMNGVLSETDIENFRKKYHQLYVPEDQRDGYLRSLIKTDAPDVMKTEVIKDSAINYLNKIFRPEKEYNTEILGEVIQGCRDSVESMIDVIQDYSINQVQNLIGNLSFHDFYTYDHSINVSMYCISIYKALKENASREELVMAGLGGLLHDLGKIKIPTHIINNPGKLSDEDFAQIKKHPGFGHELLKESPCECVGVDFRVIERVVMEHHENWNGTGYPVGLKEKEIHVMARVCAIADFFDAITTKRSYHDVLSTEQAVDVMEKSVGRKIDPKIFAVFKKTVSTLKVKTNSELELADDFDPCQPHNVLPFKSKEDQDPEKDFLERQQADHGKVKGDTDIFGKKKDKAS